MKYATYKCIPIAITLTANAGVIAWAPFIIIMIHLLFEVLDQARQLSVRKSVHSAMIVIF